MGDNYPQFEVADHDLRSHSEDDGDSLDASPSLKMSRIRSQQPKLQEENRFREEFQNTQIIHVKSSNIIVEDNDDEEELRDEVKDCVVDIEELKPKTQLMKRADDILGAAKSLTVSAESSIEPRERESE